MNAELIAERDRLSRELAEIDAKITNAKPREIGDYLERKGVIVQTISILDARRASDEIDDLKRKIADFQAQYERARLAYNQAAETRRALEPKWREKNAKIIDDMNLGKSVNIDALIAETIELYRQLLPAIALVNRHYLEMINTQAPLPGLHERLKQLERQLARS